MGFIEPDVGSVGQHVRLRQQIADAQRQREQAWLRIDPISGLPNMRALGERLQQYWRDNDGLGKACLIVAKMGNLRDLRLRYGPLQDSGLWQRDSTEEVHRLLPSLPAGQLEIYQFGDAALAQSIAARMLDHGIYVTAFSHPVVPHGRARIRVQLSAAHTDEQIDQCVQAFASARIACSG